MIADTEKAAWKKADQIVEQVRDLRVSAGAATSGHAPPNAGSQRLFDYYDLGIDHFLIHGFEPLQDAIDYGRDLLPIVHEFVAARDAEPRRAVG